MLISDLRRFLNYHLSLKMMNIYMTAALEARMMNMLLGSLVSLSFNRMLTWTDKVTQINIFISGIQNQVNA